MKDIHDDFRDANTLSVGHERLKVLARSQDEVVRAAVAMNKNTPISVKEILFNDDSDYVRECLIASGVPAYGMIAKASIVSGNKLLFTNACIDDAEFIVRLRNDEKKSRYISSTSSDVEKQREWLRSYESDNSQVYFIIRNNEERIGTVRIYDQQEDSFCWGSWILKDGIGKTCAIESALMVYAYAFTVGLNKAHFTVSKGNDSVSRFHLNFGAELVSEDDVEYSYIITKDKIIESMRRYGKYLPNGIQVIF